MGDAAALSLHLSSLSRKVSSLEESLARLTSEKDTALEEVRQLNLAMQQAEDESHNQQAAWKNAAEEFCHEQKRLKKELELLVNENKELLVCLGAQREQNSSLLDSRHTQMKSLRSEKYSASHELADRTRDCASLQSQLASQAHLVDALEKELERLTASIGDVKTSVVNQDKRLNEHKGKVHEGMVSQEALVIKINQQQETIESMREELDEAQDREAKSSERIDILESDLCRANGQLASLSAEWSESEKQLFNDAQEKKKLEDAIQHGESVIQALRGSLQEQNSKMEELKRMVQDVAMATPLLQTPTLQRGRSSTMNTPKCRGASDRRGTGRLCSSDRTPTGQRCVTMMDDDLTPSHFTTPHTTYPTDMKTPGAPIRTRGTSLIAEASEARARLNSSAPRKYSEMSWEFATTGGSSEDAVPGLRCGAGKSSSKISIGQQRHLSGAGRGDVPMLEVLQGSGSQQSQDGNAFSQPEEIFQGERVQQLSKKPELETEFHKQIAPRHQIGKDYGPRVLMEAGGLFEEVTADQRRRHSSQSSVLAVGSQQNYAKQAAFSDLVRPTDRGTVSFSQETPPALKSNFQGVNEFGDGNLSSDCMEVERSVDESRAQAMERKQIQKAAYDCPGEGVKSQQQVVGQDEVHRKSAGDDRSSEDCNKISHSSADHRSEQTREASIEDTCTESQSHPAWRGSNESNLCKDHDGTQHISHDEHTNAAVHIDPRPQQASARMDSNPENLYVMSEKAGDPALAITSVMDAESTRADVRIDKENTSRGTEKTSGIPQPSRPSLFAASKKRERSEDQLDLGVSKIPKPSSRALDAPASRNKPRSQHENASAVGDAACESAENKALSQQDSHQRREGAQGLGGLFKSLAR